MSIRSELEIKSADFYSFHKQRYYNLYLFTYVVLAFSQFPVGTYKNVDLQPPQGDTKICVFIILLRLRRVDI